MMAVKRSFRSGYIQAMAISRHRNILCVVAKRHITQEPSIIGPYRILYSDRIYVSDSRIFLVFSKSTFNAIIICPLLICPP